MLYVESLRKRSATTGSVLFAQFPGAPIVPSGDEGGRLTSGGNCDGTIQLGDWDLWTFTGNAGDRIVLRGAALTTTNGLGVELERFFRLRTP